MKDVQRQYTGQAVNRPIRFDQLVEAGRVRAGDEAIALSHGDRSLSFAELSDQTYTLADGLANAFGLSRGERLAIYLEKRIESVQAMLAGAALGAIFVPVNPVLKPAQVAHILADAGARVLVTSARRLEQLLPSLDRCCPDLERVVLVGDQAEFLAPPPARISLTAWQELELGAGSDAPPAEPATIDLDPAAIFYTSGSTGRPKGVVVSHRNLIAGAESVNSYLGNGPGDRLLAALPLSFDAGFSQLSTAFASGAEVILLDYLLPGDVVRICAERRVTGLTCVPPLWIQLAEQDWPEQAGEGLRYFASTGGRMPATTLARLREIFPRALPFLMYGLTEAFRSTYLDPAEIDRRPDSIGKAIPNAEVLVLRPDGSECRPGEKGELVHRGALVSLGYWNDPERTAERFRPIPGRDHGTGLPEPAVWSGDAVTRDEDGFLYFVERSDEMIKTSGYRVSPTEIEDAAYATDLVREAVAVGLPDQRLGHKIALAVSVADQARQFESTELQTALKRELPRFMLPDRIEVFAALPRSHNGKFDRQKIREILAEGNVA